MKNTVYLLMLSLFIFLSCDNRKTYVPDDDFERVLIYLGHDNVLDDYVLTSNIETIEYLEIAEGEEGDVPPVGEPRLSIADFTGIEDFAALKRIHFKHLDALDTLDLSKNSALTDINFYYMRLRNLVLPVKSSLDKILIYESYGMSNIDLSTSTSLTKFYVHRNTSMTSLDFSRVPLLNDLVLDDTRITHINLRNGNNTSLTNANFDVYPQNLFVCVQVDNMTWSRANWSWLSNPAIFSNDCGYSF